MSNLHIFERLDHNPIPQSIQECRAIIVTLNEGQRLPYLLRYYRGLGVDRFFVVDNNSSDGTVDFLLRQRDCHLFSTSASYAESGFGRAWQQTLLDLYGEYHWWLIIDADELFVYPSCETVPLPQLCYYLDTIGAEGVSAFMLDMYGQGPVAEAKYQPGQPFTDISPYFDRDYSFWPRPRHMKLYRDSGHSLWQLQRGHAPLLFPAMDPVGGPRLRKFYPQYVNPGPLTILRMKVMRHLGRVMTVFGIKLGKSTLMPAVLFKVPLLKGGSGVRLIDSHSVTPISLAPITGALMHFKFFADFYARVEDAIKRGEHFDGGSEYMRYLEALKTEPGLSFYYDRSVKYDNSTQLVELGLIKDDASFANYRRMQPYDTALEAITSLMDEENAADPIAASKNDLSS